MDPSQQHAGLKHEVIRLQKEVTRPKLGLNLLRPESNKFGRFVTSLPSLG